MTFDTYAKMAAAAARELEDYRLEVRALPADLRRQWALVESDNEHFDGESAIALTTLRRMLDDGSLRTYQARLTR